jgi:hypothetical protein
MADWSVKLERCKGCNGMKQKQTRRDEPFSKVMMREMSALASLAAIAHRRRTLARSAAGVSHQEVNAVAQEAIALQTGKVRGTCQTSGATVTSGLLPTTKTCNVPINVGGRGRYNRDDNAIIRRVRDDKLLCSNRREIPVDEAAA